MSAGFLRSAVVARKRQWAVAVALGVVLGLSSLGLAITSGWLIVRAFQRPAILTLTLPMGLVQLFALTKSVSRYFERTAVHAASLETMGEVRSIIARRLVTLLPAGLGPDSESAVDVVINNVERIQEFLSAGGGPLLVGWLSALIAVISTGLFAPSIATVLFAALVLNGLILPIVGERLGRMTEIRIAQARKNLHRLWFSLVSAREELLFGQSKTAIESEFESCILTLETFISRRARFAGLLQALGVLTAGFTSLWLLELTRRAILQHDLGAVFVAVPVLLGIAMMELINGSLATLSTLREQLIAKQQLYSLLDSPPPVLDPQGTDSSCSQSEAREIVSTSLTFKFGDRPILNEIDFDLAKGKWLIISGKSGNGKTTLGRLLAKFLESSSGSLSIDDRSYNRVSSREIRNAVGLAAESPHLFATTLSGNLRIANPYATDEELESVIKRVGLSVLVELLPEGLETEVGSGNLNLSGGEIRRIGLAREMLRHRQFWILDEPLEELDPLNIEILLNEVATEAKTRAIVMFAHNAPRGIAGANYYELRSGVLHPLA